MVFRLNRRLRLVVQAGARWAHSDRDQHAAIDDVQRAMPVEHDDLLCKALDVMERLGVRYMIVGSVASSFYGEPRATMDVDIVIDLPYGLVPAFCDAFPSPEFYVDPHAVGQAIRAGGQFNLLQTTTADKIDFMALRYGTHCEGQLERRLKLPVLGDREAFIARPEDVILSKMEYYRQGQSEKHLRDITGILRVSGPRVDRAYIKEWAGNLGLTDIWQAILRRLGENEQP
jgi:hypothetical protein